MAQLARFAVAGRRASLLSMRAMGARHSSPYLQSSPAVRTFSSTNVILASKAASQWKYERFAAVGLLALIPAGLVYPNAVVDYGLAFLIPLHGHWGYHSVIEDYMPQALRSPANFLLLLVTGGAFCGLMLLNAKDVGICAAVKMIWSL